MKKILFFIFSFTLSAQFSSVVSLVKTLPVLPASTSVAPIMHVESLPLTNVAQGTASINMTLTAVPIAAMGGIVYFSSSQIGGDVHQSVQGILQILLFTLPSYAFTSQDVITVTYWSLK